jgi:hypothetical protein
MSQLYRTTYGATTNPHSPHIIPEDKPQFFRNKVIQKPRQTAPQPAPALRTPPRPIDPSRSVTAAARIEETKRFIERKLLERPPEGR